MEALAAASSVLAVVSVTVQLGSVVQKLIRFWDSVKDAPTDIADIKAHLRVLCVLLRTIEIDLSQPTIFDNASLANDCLAVCSASVARLESLTSRLDVGLEPITIRRKWICLRKALSEKELEVYWRELERAKSMLLLYQGLRNGQRHDSTLQLITRLVETNCRDESLGCGKTTTDLGTYERRPRRAFQLTKVQMSSSVYELHFSFGTFRVRFHSHAVSDKEVPQSLLALMKRPKQHLMIVTFLPSMIPAHVLEWTMGYQYNSLKATMQTFNLRPSKAPIFRLCSRGDMYAVREMISNGSASPFDVDRNGWTLLHYAAAGHHVQLCQMLINLCPATNALTDYGRSPLYLATQTLDGFRDHIYRSSDDNACVDTLRILLEQGSNDPMAADHAGYTPLFQAAMFPSSQPLSWLIHQDQCEVDLRYATPGGVRAGALVAQRTELPAELLAVLLRDGVEINAPCARIWRYRRIGNKIQDITMFQLAVWTWSEKYFKSRDRLFKKGQATGLSEHNTKLTRSCFKTIKSLLDHGAEFYRMSGSKHTILDGLVLDLITFDFEARPAEILSSCLEIWLRLVQDLGFDLKDYIQHESAHHEGKSHDLGLGLHMKLCFDVDHAPYIWRLFQGPQERERNEFVDHISKCAVWHTWQRTYALLKPPPRPKPSLLQPKNVELIILNEHSVSAQEGSQIGEQHVYPDQCRSVCSNIEDSLRSVIQSVALCVIFILLFLYLDHGSFLNDEIFEDQQLGSLTKGTVSIQDKIQDKKDGDDSSIKGVNFFLDIHFTRVVFCLLLESCLEAYFLTGRDLNSLVRSRLGLLYFNS